MSWLLQVFLVVVCLVFLAYVLLMVRRDRFLLKYAFAWILLDVLGLVGAVFPDSVKWLSLKLGFETPVNFVFLVCIFILVMSSLVFVAALSRQSSLIKELVQEVSLLRAKIDGLDQDKGCHD